ncbi:serine/threonine protein phosphatase [Gordonia spumicola]|uniref:Serine/threonine protein phosphatase n=1 Tax=Gordonia spumicola TaxID=589161 RepID=A0A7I9VAM9_9ACTN|nr:metallophosphoesterase [Gordonia spumicola]GEE02397.1 serine/threonine protein phosphatase [Gordonia spumicola]
MTITYAIPDTHGCVDELRDALTKVDISDPTTSLVFLGDYVDRGPDSAGVLTAVKDQCDARPDQVIALAGNHERWFLAWIDADDSDPTWLLADTGLTTTRSFLPTEVVEQAVSALADGTVDTVNGALKREIVSRHGDLIAWMRERPLHHETATHIYVHAGVDEEAGPMWASMTTAETFTEKYPPSLGKHAVGKVIVAGHTGVGPLHAREGRMRCWEPYVDAGHVYLDGRVETTGQLNVMRYDSVSRTTSFL